MNNELYDYICKADINKSLHTVTYIILEDTESSYIQLQETFINILAYICSFISLNDAYLLSDIINDLCFFLDDDQIIIQKVYLLICKLCILCDINIRNPCIKTGTINIKDLRPKIIDIFENNFDLKSHGLLNYEHILPSMKSETYELVLKIVSGYVFNIQKVQNMTDFDSIEIISNQLKDSIDYILRKKYVEIILRDGDGELDKDFRKVIIDDLS